MSNKITLKKSSVGDKVPLPGDLEYGELALNYTDGNLFYKNSSNVVTTIASNKFVSVTGNVTGNYFIGDGSQLTNVQAGTVSIFITGGSMGTITAPVTEEEDLGQVSVESTQNLTLGTLLVDGLVDNSSIIDGVITGNKLASDINIVTTGNIVAGYFIGNGSQLTGLPASYSNIDAANYGEAGWAGNIVPAGNSVYSLGNSTRQWADLWVSNNTIYLGGVALAVDGNTLTVAGVPVLSNNGTSSISTTGNVTAGYFIGNGSLLTGLPESYTNANVATYLASGNISSNIITSGNVTGLVFIGSAVGLTSIPGANVTGTVANATYATSAGSAGSATTATTAGTVTTAAQGNITSVGTLTSLSVSGNVQGGNLRTDGLISSAGDVTGANINTSGQVSAAGNVVGGGITLGGNTIFSTGSTLTIDPSAVGVTGTVVIAGNLTVQGSTTTYDSTTVTINDLLFSVANNAATASAANGGGLEVGPAGSPYATWIYDQPNDRWNTALGINAAGNVLGGNVLASGLISATGTVTGSQFNGSGAGLSSIPGANVTGTVANATYATSAGSATTAGTVTGNAQANITSVGTLSSLSVTGNTTLADNLIFSGNGKRITGDFSNATIANRVAFQTSTVNGVTNVEAIPNGTSFGAFFTASNSSSDPGNASFASLGITNANTDVRIQSGIRGTGSYLPMTFYTGGSERVRVDTAGKVVVSSNASYNANPALTDQVFQVMSETAGDTINHVNYTGSSTVGGGYGMRSARGTFASPSAVQVGDRIGAIFMGGYTGNAFINTGVIQSYIDSGTVSATSLPTYMSFWTTPNGSTTRQERVRIVSSGELLVGSTSLASGLSTFAQIQASGTTGGVLINSATNNIGRLIFTNNNASGGEGLIRYNGSDKTLQFWSNATERARFDGSGHFVPAASNTYDLGTSTLRWRNVYTNDLHLNNGIGNWTIVEGENDLFIHNNKNGKVYKFNLTEVDPQSSPPRQDT